MNVTNVKASQLVKTQREGSRGDSIKTVERDENLTSYSQVRYEM